MRVNENVPDILQEIVAARRVELARVEQETPLLELQERVAGLRQSQSQSLLKALRGPQRGLGLIAEVKMASPSAGRLLDDVKRACLPLLYAENGASAVSVLTEQAHFCGRLEHLTEAKSSLQLAVGDDAPPLLRKDFLFEPYQVWESKAAGADAILLIAALMSAYELADLLALAREVGVECLVEVHDERELAQTLSTGAAIIGINNRDLCTFEVDLATTERLCPLIPADRIVVSESGIRTRTDIERVAACGVDAVLIGEALVTADDPGAKILELSG